MILAEMGGLLLLPYAISLLNRSKVFSIAITLIVSGLLIILLFGYIDPKQAIWIIIGGGMLRIGSGFIIGISTVALADVIDYGEVKFGQRNESVISSTNTFLTKTAQAVASLIVGVGLSILGFTPNVAQSDVTVNGIRIMIIIAPVVFIVISAFLYHKAFKLKGDFLYDIQQTLQLKRQKSLQQKLNENEGEGTK